MKTLSMKKSSITNFCQTIKTFYVVAETSEHLCISDPFLIYEVIVIPDDEPVPEGTVLEEVVLEEIVTYPYTHEGMGFTEEERQAHAMSGCKKSRTLGPVND
ncbi:17540_t:CDS:2 [Dentiscutata erythropus]|uniref:17540_t:CDS:1 n=1 Tax=Dentiscutata erythropus TaxID=1348616 RepID=A0A9N9AJC8_9GLOM|nr:17540_t:CDS:2 [Dentiscutata erythropus]